MSNLSANRTPPLPGKSLRSRIVLLLLAIGLLIVVIFVVWRIGISWNVHSRIKTLQAAGYPTSAAELRQMYYPDVPPDQNAANYYNKAFSRLTAISMSNQTFLMRTTGKPPKPFARFTSQESLKISALLTDNGAALEVLHGAPASSVCCYPLDFSMSYAMPMPHLRILKECAQLLALEAAWHGEHGDTPQAIEDLEAALRLSDSLAKEPFLISQLTRMNCENMAVSSLERILNSHPMTEAQLAQLAQDFQKSANPESMHRAMAGELCLGAAFFRMSPAQMAALVDKSGGNDDDGSSKSCTPPAAFNILTVIGLTDRDLNFYLAIMSDYLAAGKLPFPQKLDFSEKIAANVTNMARSHFYLYSSLFLPSLGGAYSREGGNMARLNIIQAVLAIERYRLANNSKLPETLTDLMPAFLTEVPLDPFDGLPLRYKKLSKGYLVYSIGPDRKDDGGADRIPRKPDSPEDITFTVER